MATSEDLNGGTFERLSPQEALDALNDGTAVMLDIRGIEEFAAERIPGAMLVPMPELQPHALPSQSDKRIILQCRSGGRTAALAGALIEAGVVDSIAHLEGGILAWKADALPTICPDPSRAVV
jgi:rhodanese-related sulfurtransferase